MRLSYEQIKIYLSFSEHTIFDTSPLFVVRSVLGRQLRALCCIAHGNRCSDCMYNVTCAYIFLFETILDKTNMIQKGRERASHPFVLSASVPNSAGVKSDTLEFCLTLAGKAIDYFPYIYASLVRAGPQGLFKSRTPFTVSGMKTAGRQLIIEGNRLCTDSMPEIWTFNSVTDGSVRAGKVNVRAVSPLRFKTEGKYTTDFDAASFFRCLERRMYTMCGLYGDLDGTEQQRYTENHGRFSGVEITGRDLVWKDSVHYSARQKRAMELGGGTGTFTMSGKFTPYMFSLLDFAQIFGAGKNTNFGLGQLNYYFWPE